MEHRHYPYICQKPFRAPKSLLIANGTIGVSSVKQNEISKPILSYPLYSPFMYVAIFKLLFLHFLLLCSRLKILQIQILLLPLTLRLTFIFSGTLPNTHSLHKFLFRVTLLTLHATLIKLIFLLTWLDVSAVINILIRNSNSFSNVAPHFCFLRRITLPDSLTFTWTTRSATVSDKFASCSFSAVRIIQNYEFCFTSFVIYLIGKSNMKESATDWERTSQTSAEKELKDSYYHKRKSAVRHNLTYKSGVLSYLNFTKV